MLVLGVDPGVQGSLALVDVDALRVLDVIDLPLIRAGKLAWVDGAVLGDWLDQLRPDLAVVELVHSYAGDPRPSNTALMCRLAGGVEAILSAFAVHAQASAWKRRAGLLKKDKAASLALASARLSWPPGALRLARDHNKAEAGLLALFGRPPAPSAPKPPKRPKAVWDACAATMPGPLFGDAKPS
jgi:hypothetical protein